MAKLFMLLIGCRPPGRFTEQHDVFFGIGETVKDLIPGIKDFWPEVKGKLHIDAWREVTKINDHAITVIPRSESVGLPKTKLFFINLGGYKKNEFEEFHYKMIITAADKREAIYKSKQTAFFKHTGFNGADSHIDDKYGIDVDDIFEIDDILDAPAIKKFMLQINPAITEHEDEIHLGYFKLDSFK